MSRRAKVDRTEQEVEAILAQLPANEADRSLIEAWLRKGPIDSQDPHEVQLISLELVRMLTRRSELNSEEVEEIFEKLRCAKFEDWRLAEDEALLRRIPDDPAAVVRRIEARTVTVSKQNSINASHERPRQHSWWRKRVDDCLDDQPDARPDDVVRYLLESGEVELCGRELRCVSGEAEPTTRAKLRSLIQSSRKLRSPAC